MGKGDHDQDSPLLRALTAVYDGDPVVQMTPLGKLTRAWMEQKGVTLKEADFKGVDPTACSYETEGVLGVTRSWPTALVAYDKSSQTLAAADDHNVVLYAQVTLQGYQAAVQIVCQKRNDRKSLQVEQMLRDTLGESMLSFRYEGELLTGGGSTTPEPDNDRMNSENIRLRLAALRTAGGTLDDEATSLRLAAIQTAPVDDEATRVRLASIQPAPVQVTVPTPAPVAFVKPAVAQKVKAEPKTTRAPLRATGDRPYALPTFTKEEENRFWTHDTSVKAKALPADAPMPQVRFWTFEPVSVPQSKADIKKRMDIDVVAVRRSPDAIDTQAVKRLIDDFHGQILTRIKQAAADPKLPAGTTIMTAEVVTTGMIPFWMREEPLGDTTIVNYFLASLEKVHAAAAKLSEDKQITFYLGSVRPVQPPEKTHINLSYTIRKKVGRGKTASTERPIIHEVSRRMYNTFFIYKNGALSLQDKGGIWWGSKEEREKGWFGDYENFAVGTHPLRIEKYDETGGLALFLNCHEFKALASADGENIDKVFEQISSGYAARGENWRQAEIARGLKTLQDIRALMEDKDTISRIRAVYHNSNYTDMRDYFRTWSRISERFGEAVPDHPGFWLYSTNLGSGNRGTRSSGLYFVKPPEAVIGYTPTVSQAPGDEIILDRG